MSNQKNKKDEIYNNSAIDLSRFPVSKKEVVPQPKFFSLENFKQSWQRMGKKNQIFTIIIVFAFVLMIILLISLFGGRGSKKVAPGKTIPPEYAPPVEYPLSPGEKYTPPFP